MSEQNINAWRRECIWLAHDQKCFYCGRPLLFRDMEIDHFVKKSISPQEFASLVVHGAIESDFDVLGLGNLVPACRRDNCDKHALTFGPRFIAIEVLKIAEKAKKVTRELEISKYNFELDQFLRKVEKAIESGSFSRDELLGYLRVDEKADPPEPSDQTKPPRPKILITNKALTGFRALGVEAAHELIWLVRHMEAGHLANFKPLRLRGMSLIEFRVARYARVYAEIRDDCIVIHNVLTKKQARKELTHVI